MRISRGRAALFSVTMVGCIGQPTGAARVNEAALDLNTHSRFGRIEVALEKVHKSERAAFLVRHRGWGTAYRVADLELVGITMKDRDNAEVLVRYAWFRPSENELHSTTVKQNWKDDRGNWQLQREERIDGDMGLLGEAVEVVQAPRGQAARFPTVHLGATGPAPLPETTDSP